MQKIFWRADNRLSGRVIGLVRQDLLGGVREQKAQILRRCGLRWREQFSQARWRYEMQTEVGLAALEQARLQAQGVTPSRDENKRGQLLFPSERDGLLEPLARDSVPRFVRGGDEMERGCFHQANLADGTDKGCPRLRRIFARGRG